MRTPNVLLIMFDQLAAHALPAYGNGTALTPHLDALAANGVVFDNAYCASPLCAPARAALMAGRLCSRIGAYDNAAEFPSEVPTFAHYLRDCGYRTLLAGKMHFVGADQLHGFEERLTTDVYPADFGWTPDWSHPERRWFWYHNMESVLEAGVYARTLELDYDEEVTHQSLRRIYDLARDTDDRRPFLLTVSFIQPHDPYMTPQPWWDRYEHTAIDMPRVPPLTGEALDPHSRRLQHVCQLEEGRITDEHVRNARHAYYGMIAWGDDQVGKLLAALEETGLREDTIVIVTSDHGDMLGERGLWYKMCFFERSARVPLIVQAPSIFAPRRVPGNVSHLDLLPTLLDIGTDGAGVAAAAPVEGSSLLPALGGAARGKDEDTVLGEYLAEGTTQPMFMIRRGTLKYVGCAGDPPQLYDLARDPDEIHNLASTPEHAPTAAAFAAEVAARWDAAGIRERVIESQQRRLFIHRSHLEGVPPRWDYQPVRDASAQYNRNYASELYDSDRRARIPRRG